MLHFQYYPANAACATAPHPRAGANFKLADPIFNRMIWVSLEGKKIKSLIPQELVYNVSDPRMPSFPKPRGMLSDDVIKKHVDNMVVYLAR